MKQSNFCSLWKVGPEFIGLRLKVCSLALVAVVVSGCATTQDQHFTITAEEFDEVAAAGPDDEPPLRGKVVRGAPAIIFDYPDSDSEVTRPFSVRLRFVPNEPATIALDTLKIKYGLLNVTNRVLKAMTVTAEGIEGTMDAGRPGKYKLKFSIEDNLQRTGRATFIFRIVD